MAFMLPESMYLVYIQYLLKYFVNYSSVVFSFSRFGEYLESKFSIFML